MKRLRAYLFIVLGLGLVFNVNVNAGIKKLGQCVEGDCTNSVEESNFKWKMIK